MEQQVTLVSASFESPIEELYQLYDAYRYRYYVCVDVGFRLLKRK